MKIINLYDGLECIVDDCDYKNLIKFKWHTLRIRSRSSIYAQGWTYGKIPKKILMHREIMKCDDQQIIDHINGNGLDNRRSNLRIVANFKNIINSKIPISNTSGYKNIRFRKDRKVWSVEFTVNNKRMYRKTFKTFDEASTMRDIVRCNLHSVYKCYDRELK